MPALPKDLVAFLRAWRLGYDPAKYEAGLVTLLSAGTLKVELFPMDCQSTPVEEDDPHYCEMGCSTWCRRSTLLAVIRWQCYD